MSAEIIWGDVPTKRQRKSEKHATPVLTLVAVDPEKKGAGRKMVFNKAAQTVLEIQGEDRVMFGFDKATKAVYVRKASGTDGFELTKTCTISHKKTFETIVERFELNDAMENEFSLVATVFGPAILEMKVLAAEVESEVEFLNRDLGEISSEEVVDADLSAIPETPEGGATYVEEDAQMETPEIISDEDFDNVVEEPAIGVNVESPLAPETSETEEEDVW
jgi:hypothetical protein